MSIPLLASETDRSDRSSTVHADLRGFLETRSRHLEDRLVESCTGLGASLGSLPRVIANAVGFDGARASRWRPLLALTAAELFGASDADSRDAALDVAAAVELTHTASLVLDDLPCMDDSMTRRGLPATHRHVGSAGAILVAVGLLGRSAELLGRHATTRAGRIAADWGRMIGLAGMSGGQAIDVAAVGRKLFGAERRLHRAKSTALPAFALASGARAAGASDAACEALASFGRSLGWAHQLRDDAMDRAEDEQLGKHFVSARPMAHSHRIMRLACHRLRSGSALPTAEADLLIVAAERLVSQPALETVRTNGAGTRPEQEIA